MDDFPIKPKSVPIWALNCTGEFGCDCPRKRNNATRPGMPGPYPKIMEHGSRGMYNRGCRCFDCRQANAEYMRDRREKTYGSS